MSLLSIFMKDIFKSNPEKFINRKTIRFWKLENSFSFWSKLFCFNIDTDFIIELLYRWIQREQLIKYEMNIGIEVNKAHLNKIFTI